MSKRDWLDLAILVVLSGLVIVIVVLLKPSLAVAIAVYVLLFVIAWLLGRSRKRIRRR